MTIILWVKKMLMLREAGWGVCEEFWYCFHNCLQSGRIQYSQDCGENMNFILCTSCSYPPHVLFQERTLNGEGPGETCLKEPIYCKRKKRCFSFHHITNYDFIYLQWDVGISRLYLHIISTCKVFYESITYTLRASLITSV